MMAMILVANAWQKLYSTLHELRDNYEVLIKEYRFFNSQIIASEAKKK
jgi:hypothetical protein